MRLVRPLTALSLACAAFSAHAALSASVKREVPVNVLGPYLTGTPVKTSAGCEDPAFDGQNVWIPNNSTNEIWRYDSVSNAQVGAVIKPAGTPAPGPRKFIFDGTYMWALMLNGQLVFKYDTTGKQVATVKLSGVSDQATFDGLAVWASTSVGLDRIDIASNAVKTFVGIPQGVVGVDQNSVWVSAQDLIKYTYDRTKGTLTETARITGYTPATGTSGFAFDGQYLWVNSDMSVGQVYKINTSTNQVIATVNVASGNHGLAFDGQYLWVVCQSSDLIEKIDVRTNQVVDDLQMVTGSNPHDIAFDGKFMWVSASGTVGTTPVGLVYKFFARL